MKISSQLKSYRLKNGIPLDRPVKKAGPIHNVYCWEGKCLTGHEWAEKLGICERAFVTRLKKHGPKSFRTFLTKEASMRLQQVEHAHPARDRSAGKRSGNAEWAALGR